jgi:hypothetical protein
MIHEMYCAPQAVSLRILSSLQWKGLRLLSEAWLAAHSAACNVWQFAVEINQLRVLGLSHTELRCLLHWGYLEHARECTTAGAPQRVFQQLSSLALPKRTCFVLTAKGREIVSDFVDEKGSGDIPLRKGPPALPRSSSSYPHWDNSSRRLYWQNNLIKEYRRPAINQELVLAALEEEGWPSRIFDPLRPRGNIDPKIRLHDTIKALNRHHVYRIIHFRGDGTGQAVGWFFVTRS